MSKNSFTVSKKGNGDFASIQEALCAASDGDKIFIESGTYNESLTIDKNVEITGTNNKMPLVFIKSGTVCTVTAKAVINFIHFNNKSGKRPDKKKPGDKDYTPQGMVGISSDAIFNNCEFSGSFDSNVQVWGEEVKAEFYNCNVHNGKGNGFYLQEGCKPVIKKCRIHNNKYGGILVEKSFPDISDCDIYKSKHFLSFIISDCAGIIMKHNSSGSYKNCIIHNISGTGIFVSDNSTPDIENCNIYDCTISGLTVFDNSDPYIENLNIYNCKVNKLLKLVLKLLYPNNTINNITGIAILQKSSGSYKNCIMHNIEGAGIFVFDNSAPNVENCKIYSCKKDAYITIYNNSTGIYTNCSFAKKNSKTKHRSKPICTIYADYKSQPVIENCGDKIIYQSNIYN